MDWQWKLEQLMDQHAINTPQALANQILEQFPEAAKQVGETTARMILNNTIDRISQTGLVTLCRFFHLKSLSQLVDFDDAPDVIFGTWEHVPKMHLRFKLQSVLNQLQVPQQEFADHCSISVSTVNRFCRGSNDRVSFDSLIRISRTLRLYTLDDPKNPKPWLITPTSITDLLEVEASAMRSEHPALENQRKVVIPPDRIFSFQEDSDHSTNPRSLGQQNLKAEAPSRQQTPIPRKTSSENLPIIEPPTSAKPAKRGHSYRQEIVIAGENAATAKKVEVTQQPSTADSTSTKQEDSIVDVRKPKQFRLC